ncbi:hypothetical protein [Sporosarcina aquimarina]|uniref:Tetratricopeptide repeat protein n=1 Tax=Sporosarcina aquimarina TaxID=114975 RepID=A0ABU4FV31_9BACL|nr:hypothetical protein [Sporosarcina aquimarina]MDW0108575.1 hypothetical protein [Sporosarcina aquimarina]
MKDNPFLIRGVARWLLLFGGGIVLTIVLLFANIPFWAVFLIVMIVYLTVTLGWPLYILYGTKDMKRLDAFLTKNRFNSLFAYAYAIGHESDEMVIDTIENILQTQKQPKIQAIYGANLAIWQKDAEALHRIAIHLPTSDYVNYYTASALLLEGNLQRAEAIQPAIKKPWMRHALQASIAKQSGNQTAYRREVELATSHARGVQYYVLVSLFKRQDQVSPII